jgi:hypothetical protein
MKNEFNAIVRACVKEQKIPYSRAAREIRELFVAFNAVLEAGEELEIPRSFWLNGLEHHKPPIHSCVIKKVGDNHLNLLLS